MVGRVKETEGNAKEQLALKLSGHNFCWGTKRGAEESMSLEKKTVKEIRPPQNFLGGKNPGKRRHRRSRGITRKKGPTESPEPCAATRH